MNKQIVLYVHNGEVVDEAANQSETANQSDNFVRDAWNFFFSGKHDQTVGGNNFERGYQCQSDGNGREFDPATGETAYTVAAGKHKNPYECNVKIIPGYGAESATDSGL